MGAAAVTLRPLRVGDVAAVLTAFSGDPEMDRQGTVRDLAEARAYVDGLLDDAGGVRASAVVVDDVMVGLVGITVDEANRNGWFWYWTTASHRGLGITTRAATAVANRALRTGGLHRLELGHRTNNPASRRVAEAVGFVVEGREREKFLVDGQRIDVLTYGRLRTDPWPDDPAGVGFAD